LLGVLNPVGRHGIRTSDDLVFQALFRYMSKYPSLRFQRTRAILESSFNILGGLMAGVSRNSLCATIADLAESGFYKRKYAAYSIYSSAMTSCPILFHIGTDAEIRDAIISKAANVIAIKIIDNLNDSFHSVDRALRSISKHRESFLSPGFLDYNSPKEFVDKAENTAFLMGRWTYSLTWEGMPADSYCLRLFKASIDRYVGSQIESLKQKAVVGLADDLSLRYYFEKIGTKGDVGNMWLDIDFGTIEKRHGIDGRLRSVLRHLKLGAELFFRSLLLYDDVSDFDIDLRDGILNAAALYAWETGRLTRADLLDYQSLRRKVDEEVMHCVIALGDLLYAKSIEQFEAASSLSDEMLDIPAYIFSNRIIRIFVMRKWAFQKRNVAGLKFSLRSFYDPADLVSSLPDEVVSYGERLLRSTKPYIELPA